MIPAGQAVGSHESHVSLPKASLGHLPPTAILQPAILQPPSNRLTQ